MSNVEDEISLLFPISNYTGGYFKILTNEEATNELRKCFKEAFGFDVRFSSKKTKANEIESEIVNRIERIIELLRNSILQSIGIEKRMVDKGRYDLVRLDIKQNGGNEIFEFNYFID